MKRFWIESLLRTGNRKTKNGRKYRFWRTTNYYLIINMLIQYNAIT